MMIVVMAEVAAVAAVVTMTEAMEGKFCEKPKARNSETPHQRLIMKSC